MIKELVNFTESIDIEFRSLGIKPKEGLHIMLRIRTDKEKQWIDEHSIVQFAFTSKKDGEENSFLKTCASLTQISWCINPNKCFDLPAKGIHSCSPYCVAFKKESIEGGRKYKEDKVKVYDRFKIYFNNTYNLLSDEGDKQQARLFEGFITNKEQLHNLLYALPLYDTLKDADYIIFYLDVPLEKYRQANARYLSDKLFNTNEYNYPTGLVTEETLGTSGFFNSFPDKKPLLKHQTASFDLAGRISGKEAKILHEFQNILRRNILPKPLPIFIYNEEVKTRSIALFKEAAIKGERISYKEIIESLYKSHKQDLCNYYLLFYENNTIRDFDFISKFEYALKDEHGEKWKIYDLFTKYNPSIENVFDFQYAVLIPVFNNALISKTKNGDLRYRYFDDIDSKYCKSYTTYLQVVTYRKAFYDFIYKSKRKAITQQMFDTIMLTSILEDIRLDEYKSNQHSQDFYIRQKMNIWFSLSEKFITQYKMKETMASNLQTHREFIRKLAKSETSIQTDEQYAFAAGQVIFYLLTKSKTADRSYKRLEPFLQQVHAIEMNKSIGRLFDSYKHEKFSSNFRTPFAEVLDYSTNSNIRNLMPIILAGVFSKNELFSDKEVKEEIEEEVLSEE